MNTLIIFRGKAATGKTLLTDLLSTKMGIPVLRKDDVYDSLSGSGLDHSRINRFSFEVLAKILRTNMENGCDLILDISLAHTPYMEEFLAKIPLNNTRLLNFLCTCSDEERWRDRIRKRIDNPTPNQLFSSPQEAADHYERYDIRLMEGEQVLDSAEEVSVLLELVRKALKS